MPPELLESKPEIIECVVEQLDHMEANLKRAKKGDLKVSVHRMEIERIRYVLSSYLRCRLAKIEKFFPHVLEKEKSRAKGEPSILSPEEFAFAKEYMANTETYLKNVALKHMPPNLQKVALLKSVPKPNLDSFVFLRVLKRQENILVEPETDEQREYTIDLEEGLTAPDPVQDHCPAGGLRSSAAHLSEWLFQVYSTRAVTPPAMPVDLAMRLCLGHSPPIRKLLNSYEELRGSRGRKPLRSCLNLKQSTDHEPGPEAGEV